MKYFEEATAKEANRKKEIEIQQQQMKEKLAKLEERKKETKDPKDVLIKYLTDRTRFKSTQKHRKINFFKRKMLLFSHRFFSFSRNPRSFYSQNAKIQ